MTLQLEMISCGDCRKCLMGAKPHGPYFYDYYRANGRMVSEYVGKLVTEEHADDQHPESSTPEDLYPKVVEEMVSRSEADAESREAELSDGQRANLDKVMSLQAGVRKAQRHRARAEDLKTAEQFQEEAAQLRDSLVSARAALRESISETTGV